MKAGRLLSWRESNRTRPPSRGEILGTLAFFATLYMLGCLAQLIWGQP